MRVVWKKKFLVKFWENVCVCVCVRARVRVRVCVWSKMMFLTLVRQSTTPQILKADISCAYIGPETVTEVK